MKKEKETFASTMKLFEHKYDLRTVFDDFLTMSLCAMAQNTATMKSYDEDLYLETVAKYKTDEKLVQKFPHLLAHVIMEMEERWDSGEGYDVLGEFYELNLSRKGIAQIFTPWPVCMFMAQSICSEAQEKTKEDRPLRVLDPACGSGRMLLAAQKCNGQQHEYYGIDIDHTCTKMTALNLFLSGLFHAEALCADALLPEDFRVSYRTSFRPFGVFRVKEKEQSALWHMLKNSWAKPVANRPKPEYEGTTTKYPDWSQLQMF